MLEIAVPILIIIFIVCVLAYRSELNKTYKEEEEKIKHNLERLQKLEEANDVLNDKKG